MKMLRTGVQPFFPIVLFCVFGTSLAEDNQAMSESAPVLQYHRMYVDSDGESHFDTGQMTLTYEDYAPPAKPIAVHPLQQAEGATLLYMPKGSFEDWHPAPRRQFAFILKGTVEVTVTDGEVRRFEPGTIVLLEDTTGRGHTTRIVGDEDHVSVMVPVPAGT